jgi:Spy/CpxP family protein refolding chaperone
MKIFRNLAMLAVCALATAAVAQQDTTPPQGGEGHGHRRGMPSAEDQVKNLTERLNLTSDQQAKVKTIVEDTHSQMQKLMQDDSLSPDDRRSKVRSLHESASSKIREILTDDQKKKFDDMQTEMQNRMHQRQGGGDNPPPK